MKSSQNIYLSNLDHLRGFAAFLVFTWHFTHHGAQCPELCYDFHYSSLVTLPFMTFLEQGHTGVALFLCISGYIFTRLTYGKKLNLLGFWKNRILRLLPLLIFVGLCEALILYFTKNIEFDWQGIRKYIHTIFHPGGSWTVYMELRYYVILPFLLFAMRKISPLRLLAVLLFITFSYRVIQWNLQGSVQYIAYHKLIGRLDQFLAGSAAFYIEQLILKRHSLQAARLFKIAGIFGAAALLATYQYFSMIGGYYHMEGKSTSIIWIFLPLIEGICYSTIIIAYLTLNIPSRLDIILRALGRWSYSIYLNHFFLLPSIFAFIYIYFSMPEGFYERLAIGTLLVFPVIVAISALTYHFIEQQFLRLRTTYLQPVAA